MIGTKPYNNNSLTYELLDSRTALVRVLTGDAALFSGWGVRI